MSTSPCRLRRMLDNFVLGLRVLADELTWLVLRGLRALELRQLRQRRQQEVLEARRLCTTPAPPGEETMRAEEQRQLACRQADFLQEEMDLLERDFLAKRQRAVAARLERWHLN